MFLTLNVHFFFVNYSKWIQLVSHIIKSTLFLFFIEQRKNYEHTKQSCMNKIKWFTECTIFSGQHSTLLLLLLTEYPVCFYEMCSRESLIFLKLKKWEMEKHAFNSFIERKTIFIFRSKYGFLIKKSLALITWFFFNGKCVCNHIIKVILFI